MNPLAPKRRIDRLNGLDLPQSVAG